MPKSTAPSLTIAVSPASTQGRPLVQINGDDYDFGELTDAIQAARSVLPTDTFSRVVGPVAGDAKAASSPVPANDAAGLKTPV